MCIKLLLPSSGRYGIPRNNPILPSSWLPTLFEPALAKLHIVLVRFLGFDFLGRTLLPPFLLQVANIPLGGNCSCLLVGFWVDPPCIDFIHRLGHGPPAPEMHHIAIKCRHIVGEMTMREVVTDDVGDKALDQLQRLAACICATTSATIPATR